MRRCSLAVTIGFKRIRIMSFIFAFPFFGWFWFQMWSFRTFTGGFKTRQRKKVLLQFYLQGLLVPKHSCQWVSQTVSHFSSFILYRFWVFKVLSLSYLSNSSPSHIQWWFPVCNCCILLILNVWCVTLCYQPIPYQALV